MTADDPLVRAAQWCAHLSEVLADAGRRAAQLGELIGRDWPDPHGREWAERTAQLGSALGREAVAAADLGAAYGRQPADPPAAADPPPHFGPGALAGRRSGMRLGGTDAARVEDERGMRIAELGPPPAG